MILTKRFSVEARESNVDRDDLLGMFAPILLSLLKTNRLENIKWVRCAIHIFHCVTHDGTRTDLYQLKSTRHQQCQVQCVFFLLFNSRSRLDYLASKDGTPTFGAHCFYIVEGIEGMIVRLNYTYNEWIGMLSHHNAALVQLMHYEKLPSKQSLCPWYREYFVVVV